MTNFVELLSTLIAMFSIVYNVKIVLYLLTIIKSYFNGKDVTITIPVNDKDCMLYALYLLGWYLILS